MARAFDGIVLSVLVMLALSAPARGQASPWSRLFGPRTPDKVAPAPAPAKPVPPKPVPVEPRRLAEIQVEIAWLADPLTFPYFLEARSTNSGVLEVRGYVPNRALHDHALNVARVYSSLTVVDAVKEHPSLQVKPGQMSSQQLHVAVTTALREAIPKHAAQLQVQAGNNGQVAVTGMVPSHEDRLAVSHALRRLYGCTSVQNLTQVPPEATTREPAAAADATTKGGLKLARPDWSQLNTNPKRPVEPTVTKEPPSVRPEVQTTAAARERPERPSAETKEPAAAPTAPPASPAVAARLKKKIEEACPGVKAVHIDVVSATEFRIEVTATTEDQVGTFAGKILMLQELQDYKSDLQFKVMP